LLSVIIMWSHPTPYLIPQLFTLGSFFDPPRLQFYCEKAMPAGKVRLAALFFECSSVAAIFCFLVEYFPPPDEIDSPCRLSLCPSISGISLPHSCSSRLTEIGRRFFHRFLCLRGLESPRAESGEPRGFSFPTTRVSTDPPRSKID